MPAEGNRIIYGGNFMRDIRRLPTAQQRKLADLLGILKAGAFDPRLHTKPLGAPLQGMFSFRITRDYRVGFKFYAPRVLQLLAADHRDKIYERLVRKPQ